MLRGTEVKIAGIHPGCEDSDGVIVGVMAYSDDHRVVLVADEDYIGMPVNVCWLTSAGRTDMERAKCYRERYLAAYPGTLKD